MMNTTRTYTALLLVLAMTLLVSTTNASILGDKLHNLGFSNNSHNKKTTTRPKNQRKERAQNDPDQFYPDTFRYETVVEMNMMGI